MSSFKIPVFIFLFAGLMLASFSCKSRKKQKEEQEESNVSTTWVHIDPVQCQGNPWEEAWKEDQQEYSFGQEPQAMKEYYGDKGVKIYDYKTKRVYEIVCEACSCPRGDVVSVKVADEDVSRMLTLGFRTSFNKAEE